MKNKKTINFGGIVGNFTKNPQTGFGEFNNTIEKQREKKHLKAYLRGDERYSFGKDEQNHPIWYPVLRSETPVI